MVDTWTIRVDDRSYGPYTLEQLRSYAGQGRLAPHSLVARAGDGTVHRAADDPHLAALFRPAARPVFFTADGEGGRQSFGRNEREVSSDACHYIIIADMKSRSIAGLEEEIFSCGPAFAIMPQAWLVSSSMTINAMRNALVQKLGRLDVLFIVDATHNKAAWFNYGPEADSRIRRLWQKSLEQLTATGG
ncbi:MAG: DUF4339 domain-containing protein [Alphaproteobacteria bacterium]|nr:DUF4339 domain-containing protein [Alphaproteobacteria bacterium]